jgi:hypothetical protein
MADEDRKDRAMTRDDEETEALAPFIAAARAEEPVPRIALLNAILADAADVSAARWTTDIARAPDRWTRLRALLEPVGGWRGAAALGLCAALGFWIGMSDEVAIEGTTVWAGAAAEAGADPVTAFFDLAAAE